MKVGFLSDKNGFRAPLHPDSLKKYDKTQLFVDKDISVLSTKDLNPEILIFVNLNVFPCDNNYELFCQITYI